jgi:acetyl esterase/lipase
MHDQRTFRLASLVSLALLLLGPVLSSIHAQDTDELAEIRRLLESHIESLNHELAVVNRRIDDTMFFHRVGDIADINIVSFTGPPRRHEPNPTAQGAGNPLRSSAYVFVPKDLDRARSQPLLVYPHGGVHANFNTGTTNRLREMLEQGYFSCLSGDLS